MQRHWLCLLPLALAGCLAYLPPAEPPEHAGTVVEVACPPALEGFLRAQAAPWSARHQAEVRAVPPGAKADVRFIRPAEVLALAPGLLPVPVEMTQEGNPFEWRGLLRFYGSQLCRAGRVAVAVPVLGEAPVCLYRADLIGSPAVAARFAKLHPDAPPLRPPATWEEFARLAAFFRADDPEAKGVLPPLPIDDAALDRLFHTVAASHARRAVRDDEPITEETREQTFYYYYDSKGQPRIDSAGFVAALRLLKRLQPARHPGPAKEPMEAVLRGEAVLAFADAGWLAQVQKVPALRDRFAACMGPGTAKDGGVNRIPYLGGAGWMAVVPKDAKSPGAAWSLLADLAGPARSMQAAQEPVWGGGPTRAAPLLRDRWDSFGLEPQVAQALKEALDRTLLTTGIKNPVLVLRTPDHVAKRAVLMKAVRAALAGGDPEQLLKAAAAEWRKMDGDPARALAAYKRSVGLE